MTVKNSLLALDARCAASFASRSCSCCACICVKRATQGMRAGSAEERATTTQWEPGDQQAHRPASKQCIMNGHDGCDAKRDKSGHQRRTRTTPCTASEHARQQGCGGTKKIRIGGWEHAEDVRGNAGPATHVLNGQVALLCVASQLEMRHNGTDEQRQRPQLPRTRAAQPCESPENTPKPSEKQAGSAKARPS